MRQLQPKKGTIATIIIIATSMLAIGAADARNKSDRRDVAVTVPYADLNLQRPEGAKTLYQRLQQAAKQACDINAVDIDKNLAIRSDARNCYRMALSGAIAEFNNEHLNRLHNATL